MDQNCLKLPTDSPNEPKKEEGYFFHITSLRPINPHNQPDSQERAALASFEQGLSESWWQQELNGVPYFRYMAPLKVEQGCMKCHAKQGYRLGDVRGGISVSLQMGALQNQLQRNSWIILGLALLTIGVQVGLVGIFFRGLIRKLADARIDLNRLASTDQLTGLANRYTMFARLEQEFQRQQRSQQKLSLAMIDIDFFKAVNDNFGHPTGDTVLRQVAEQIMQGMRQYDVASRFGGEEFLIMLPGSDLAQALASAERLRATIEAQVHVGEAAARKAISVSIGVACLEPGQNMATLIQRADAALYRAKAEGRNRVVASES